MTAYHWALTVISATLLTTGGFMLLGANYHAQRQHARGYALGCAAAFLCYLAAAWFLTIGPLR